MNKIFIGIILVVAMMTINKTATAQTSGNQSNWNTPILTNIIPASGTSGTSGSSSGSTLTVIPSASTPTSVSPNPPAATSSGVTFQSTNSINTPDTPPAPIEFGVYPGAPPTGVTLSPGGTVTISVTSFFPGEGVSFIIIGESAAGATLG